jgi:hypothetical protein
MARRIVDALARALAGRTTPSPYGAQPHFHQGAQGNAAACFVEHCDRPRLDVL